MKKLISFLLLAIVQTSVQAECLDFSHKRKIGIGDMEARQSGCEKISRQMFFAGQPFGEANVVYLNGKWKILSVDDEYESYTSQTRWSWNSTQTALVYEYHVDVMEKASGNSSLHSGIQTYSRTEANQIKFDHFEQIRVMRKDGTIEVKQDQTSELLETLPTVLN